ncbi:MAG: nickel-dependent hydrogenase large subunit [Actinobacteria bacterium]|nr:nickel-dependent hydrogenase large subunit [Actinomycetota bacterium]
MSHITHFYHLAALSYVQGPGIAPWTPYFDNSYYVAALQKPAGRDLPTGTDVWDKVIADYVVALGMRRVALDAAAIFTGRTPMQLSLVIGGTTYTKSQADIDKARTKLNVIKEFIARNYIPLVAIVGGILYPSYLSVGRGHGNLLAWGVFDEDLAGGNNPNRLLKRGYVLNGNNASLVRTLDPDALVFEHTKYSRYDDDPTKTVHKNTAGLQPKNGYTNPNWASGYTWAKAPRIRVGSTNYPMEVGPLARMAVHGADRSGAKTNVWDDYKLGEALSYQPVHALLGTFATVNWTTGISVMDRHLARAFEAMKIIDRITGTGGWLDQLALKAEGASSYTEWTMPSGRVSGYGAHEAPRGALAHWVEVTDGKISNYQCVVPTTWNVGPRDADNTMGTIEQAISGAAISGVKSGGQAVPVEALRIVQSFDPCIACTVHVVDGEGLSGKEVG